MSSVFYLSSKTLKFFKLLRGEKYARSLKVSGVHGECKTG